MSKSSLLFIHHFTGIPAASGKKDVPDEVSGTEDADDGDVPSVLRDVAVLNQQPVDVVEADRRDLEVIERHADNLHVHVVVAVDTVVRSPPDYSRAEDPNVLGVLELTEVGGTGIFDEGATTQFDVGVEPLDQGVALRLLQGMAV